MVKASIALIDFRAFERTESREMMPIEDLVTLTLPRSAIADIVTLPAILTGRMHELLERNADQPLSGVEREEVEMLVRIAQLGQLISLSIQTSGKA